MTEATTRPAKTRRRRGRSIIPFLLVLAGVALLLYPVVATQYNNVKQHRFAMQYNQEVAGKPTQVREAALKKAHEYNSKLTGVPILDPYLEIASDNPGSNQWKYYRTVLGEGSSDVMARVRVPTGKIDLPVRHGTSQRVLAEGAGHLYGTALPVGGKGTHAVITSHTGMASATLFDHLTSVKEGDYMFIDVEGETLAYKVDQIKVVLPDEIGDLKAVPGHDYLTLFTCTPYAVNSHRLLVRGERVPFTAEVAEQAKQQKPVFVMESWMWWLIAGAAFGVIASIVLIVLGRRRRRTAEDASKASADPAKPTDVDAEPAAPTGPPEEPRPPRRGAANGDGDEVPARRAAARDVEGVTDPSADDAPGAAPARAVTEEVVRPARAAADDETRPARAAGEDDVRPTRAAEEGNVRPARGIDEASEER